MVAESPKLKAPFQYFGGKARVAAEVWRRFGDVPIYVEPFAGSLAVLLARPSVGRVETVNDLDCDISNFWRAIQHDPKAVAQYANRPVIETDLHAWRVRLQLSSDEHRRLMHSDPDHFDTKRAGIWVWGVAASLNWNRPKPSPIVAGHLRGQGCCLPVDIETWFASLCKRLRYVRVMNGDWTRCVSDAVTGASLGQKSNYNSPCAVFLDPPYSKNIGRNEHLYAEESDVAVSVRHWATEHDYDPHFRIALCGYEGEHEMPENWTVFSWQTQGGHANRGHSRKDNRGRERIWFSPHCLSGDPETVQQPPPDPQPATDLQQQSLFR